MEKVREKSKRKVGEKQKKHERKLGGNERKVGEKWEKS